MTIKGKWITKARKGQKKYRLYRRYTSSGRNELLFQSDSLAEARKEADIIHDRAVRKGNGIPIAFFLVNKEGKTVGM